MEQVKRYVGRAAALALACFVVAFSVSVPAAAATVADDINAKLAVLQTIITYSDGSYTQLTDTTSNPVLPFREPLDDPYTVAPSVNNKNISSVRVVSDFEDYPTGKKLQFHVKYLCYAYSNISVFDGVNLYAGSYDGTWVSIPFTVISSSSGRAGDANRFYSDYIIEFELPVNSVRFRTYTNFYFDGLVGSGLGSVWGGIQVAEFLYIDQQDIISGALDDIINPTPEDNQQVGQISGSVTDKTQQSNQITNQIEQLQKPNVDSSSGKPVVGGMVVDPMQQVDRDSFNAYTNVLGTIFGSSTILGYFIIVFSLIFISYVIFGKSGG